VTPRKATFKDLAAYHTRDYLEVVLSRDKAAEYQQTDAQIINQEFGLEDVRRKKNLIGTRFLICWQDCPLFPGISDYVQLVGGATLTAVTALQQNVANVAICWDGGRHHARKNQASGFCYVADCILAILALKRPPLQNSPPLSQLPVPADGNSQRKPRIMYLDLDLHFSDAVSEAFYSPKSSSQPQILVRYNSFRTGQRSLFVNDPSK